MSEVFSFLNSNQGAVMAILTFVYAVATIVITYFNKKSIDEMKASREADSRPYLFAYLAYIPCETKRCRLILRNYGKRGAIIKAFSISPSVDLPKGKSDCGFFSGTTIAPGQSIQILVLDKDLETKDTTYVVKTEYEDSMGGNRYSESYTLIQQYVNELTSVTTNRSGMTKPESAVIDIAHSLDTIKNHML